jgi:hypothetical protein
MKPLGTILLMLLAAAVAAVITYLAVSNQRLRESIAQREAAEQAARLAATQPAPTQPTKPPPAPWRPTRISTNGSPVPSPAAAQAADPTERGTDAAPADNPAPDSLPGTVVTVPGPPVLVANGSIVRFYALPGSKVRIEGTSSLHPWEVNGSIIGGSVDQWGPAWADVRKAAARIPIRTLKSYQKAMDEVLQATMEMSRFPNIDYELIKLEWKSTPKMDQIEYEATGSLTIHGITVTNTMPVTFVNVDNLAKLKISGTTPLKMTDFGIKPVDVNLGIGHITTGDDVTVSFEWLVGRDH